MTKFSPAAAQEADRFVWTSFDFGDRALADWDEAKHPRDGKGQFATGSGGGSDTASGNGGTRGFHGDPATWRYSPETDSQHVYKENGKYTPERAALHDHLIATAVPDTLPKSDALTVYMMGGGSAAGKSTVLESGHVDIPNKFSAAHLNPDDFKEGLPEYNQMVKVWNRDAAGIVHEESSDITAQAMQKALRAKNDIVMDATGDGTIEKLTAKVNGWRAGGAHRIVANYVTTDVDQAVVRSDKRFELKGRFVMESVLRENHRAVAQIVPEAMRRGLFDELKLWDTSAGGTPKLVASSRGKEPMTIHHQALWDTFIARGKVKLADAAPALPVDLINAVVLAQLAGKTSPADAGLPNRAGLPRFWAAVKADLAKAPKHAIIAMVEDHPNLDRLDEK